MLTVLIAAAVAFAPVGAAMAASAPAPSAHAMHHGHHAMQMAAASDESGVRNFDHKAAGSKCCCPDKGACAQTCFMKCFGQLAVITPDRSARAHAPLRFVALSAERPPDWSSGPQPPPPRA